MFDYDEAGERATRDIVSRAIYDEMRKGHTTPNGGVYIAMSHLGPDSVSKRFPGMVKRCADCGFDLAGGRVEVVPTAHYLMGGLICDPETRTGLPGLYVAGEDAGGAHGSNRLGGNGVANSTVYGGIAGDVMAADASRTNGDGLGLLREPDEAAITEAIAAARQPFGRRSGNVHHLRNRLMDMMWDDVGVKRTADGLKRGLEQLADFKRELFDTGLADEDLTFNITWHDWLNLQSLIEMSEVVASAALWRENSRGAHHREDFPDSGDLDTSYFTVVRRNDNNDLDVTREPVVFSIVKPGETLLKDEPDTLVANAR